ncbi:2-keto-3-deoxy-galactonokinase [Shimia gijangensis]|uniref:2-keto-3-deoxy-galactonokinase n=1 Tax=Shimia gijangensis TaxID=1470563 RepID=A0A1M6IC08_9RHOB|nr:2-dehydro-3-deoxygalactonokinase [Shimia gijangensis]SHJ31937.1 2-keto-3-deoxy-galactonokinase [Shimia gijangensis]
MSELPTAKLGELTRKVPCKVIVPVAGLVAGLVQESPADRATGAQVVLLAGVVAARPNWDGVVCLVGARTLWAHVSAGEVVSFSSFVTVQLAESLSVISKEGFDKGLDITLSRPEKLATELAQADVAPGRSWGALMGAELAATRPYWLGQEVVLIGEGTEAEFYAQAIARQGAMLQRARSSDVVTVGQHALIAAGKQKS